MRRANTDMRLESRFFKSAKAFLMDHIRSNAGEDGWCAVVASRLGPAYGYGRTTLATTLQRLEAKGLVERRSVPGRGIIVRLTEWAGEGDS